jgi:hypothetical protein
MIAITKYLSEANEPAGSTLSKMGYWKDDNGRWQPPGYKPPQVAQTIPVAAVEPQTVQVAPAAQPAAAQAVQPAATRVVKKAAPKITKRIVTAPQPPAGVPAVQPAVAQADDANIRRLTASVKAGARVGSEKGYEDAVKLAAARRAAAPVQTVAAVHPPVAKIVTPVTQPVVATQPVAQQVVAQQPVPVTNVAKAVRAADISGSQAAGIALKKGAQSAGEAVGSLGNKTMELAGEHPGMAGAAAGVVGALGLRKLFNRNKQQP